LPSGNPFERVKIAWNVRPELEIDHCDELDPDTNHPLVFGGFREFRDSLQAIVLELDGHDSVRVHEVGRDR
jgi:hypothetical protein